MSLIESFNWRYATKKYDPSKIVEEDKVAQIIEAVRLAPTSSGLQPFRLLVISNQELKEKIVSASFNEQILKDSSHLLVFAAWSSYTEERIDTIAAKQAEARGIPLEASMAYYGKLKSMVLSRSAEENFQHAAKQTYIGLGFALAEAAALRVDSTPMEGFDSAKLDELLGLDKQGLRSVVLLSLGYRDVENDKLSKMNKVRMTTEEFVEVYS